MGSKKTTITLSLKNATKFNKLKYDLGCSSVDEVVDKIFDIITKFKLAGELK